MRIRDSSRGCPQTRNSFPEIHQEDTDPLQKVGKIIRRVTQLVSPPGNPNAGQRFSIWSLGGLVETEITGSLPECDSGGLGCPLSICISTKSLSDASATGPETSLWEPLIYKNADVRQEADQSFFAWTRKLLVLWVTWRCVSDRMGDVVPMVCFHNRPGREELTEKKGFYHSDT